MLAHTGTKYSITTYSILIGLCNQYATMKAYLLLARHVVATIHTTGRMMRDMTRIFFRAYDEPDFVATSLIEYGWVTAVYDKITTVSVPTYRSDPAGRNVLPLQTRQYVYRGLVPSCSVTGTLQRADVTLIDWSSKYQPTIETITRETVIVALCTCVERSYRFSRIPRQVAQCA